MTRYVLQKYNRKPEHKPDIFYSVSLKERAIDFLFFSKYRLVGNMGFSWIAHSTWRVIVCMENDERKGIDDVYKMCWHIVQSDFTESRSLVGHQ